MASGFVKLPHDVIDRYGDDPEKLGAFVWLLRSRDFKTGILETSVRNLAAQFGWSHGKAQRLHADVTECSVGMIDDKWYKSGTPSGTLGPEKRYTGDGANQQESLAIQDSGNEKVVHLRQKSGTPSGREAIHPPPQTRGNNGSAGPLDVDVVDNYLTTPPLSPKGDNEDTLDLESKAKSKPAKKRTSAPEFADFEITEGMRTWFNGKGWTAGTNEVLNQTESFLDWHRSKGNTMLDWVAAWRTWMHRWQTNHGQSTTPHPPNGGPYIPNYEEI